MKSVKYNIEFYDLNGNKFNYMGLNMNETVAQIKLLVKDKCNLDIKISKHIVYNLIHRDNVNPFLKKICKVEKV